MFCVSYSVIRVTHKSNYISKTITGNKEISDFFLGFLSYIFYQLNFGVNVTSELFW